MKYIALGQRSFLYSNYIVIFLLFNYILILFFELCKQILPTKLIIVISLVGIFTLFSSCFLVFQNISQEIPHIFTYQIYFSIISVGKRQLFHTYQAVTFSILVGNCQFLRFQCTYQAKPFLLLVGKHPFLRFQCTY